MTCMFIIVWCVQLYTVKQFIFKPHLFQMLLGKIGGAELRGYIKRIKHIFKILKINLITLTLRCKNHLGTHFILAQM